MHRLRAVAVDRGDWLEHCQERRKTGGARPGGGGGSDPPDPHGRGNGGDEWHREWQKKLPAETSDNR
eukprot:5638963-Amphidinium_carterae.4